MGDFEIIVDKPILVGQFLVAENVLDPNVNGIPQSGDVGIGDPVMMLTVFFEQYWEDYVVLVSNKYELDYVNVVVLIGVVVDFDGMVLDVSLFESIGIGEFSTVCFLVEDGVHSLAVGKMFCIKISECFDGWCADSSDTKVQCLFEDGASCVCVKTGIKIGIIVYGYD